MLKKTSVKSNQSGPKANQVTVRELARKRIVIEDVQPEIDGGTFPIKRTIGEKVVVAADIFADGHDALSCVLLYRPKGQSRWLERPLDPLVNDRWQGDFAITNRTAYQYTLIAWIDRFKSWHRDLVKKLKANQDVDVDIAVGVQLIQAAGKRATGSDAQKLKAWVDILRLAQGSGFSEQLQAQLIGELAVLVARYPDRSEATTYDKVLDVVVDREKARFSAWYEMFPRSLHAEPGMHGTFQDCQARLGYVAQMGFDVLYLPPIHPIGMVKRKGKNNSTSASPGEPGSPWAIGSQAGGHMAVHPDLGTMADFRQLVAQAKSHGLELAMDIAFQCAPDHPYVSKHPGWFRQRPDGHIQYAENPPKKYEDIYPFDFECEACELLWEELKRVFLFWIEHGVKIFRVDNPHTKPFPFWQWVIAQIKRQHDDVLFLSEAFTRPKVMNRLAKVGFSQSYTYFTWRNTKQELIDYFTELTQTQVREYFRPNLWPNTPDILPAYLQAGGRPAFMIRLVLAATLGANYGIYGPAFELCESRPREPGSEEYLDSEKYEIRHWDIDQSGSLRHLISRLNQIRRENRSLQSDDSLRFHDTDHEHLLCYSKNTDDLENMVVVVVNLSPCHRATGHVVLPLADWGIECDQPYQMHDLLSDARYVWQGARNYVELDPEHAPAHVFCMRRRLHREQDFDYYM